MLYPNNHCIRMKRILLSKHCYIEYIVKATSFIILVNIKSIWAGPCETVTTLPSIETGCKEKNEHDSLLSVSKLCIINFTRKVQIGHFEIIMNKI